MSRPVLDASALIAVLHDEPGAEVVTPLLRDALISAVNLSEAIAKLSDRVSFEQARDAVSELQIEVAPFDEEIAVIAAGLRGSTRPFGLSLADRACLATAATVDGEALTGDRVWAELPVDIRVRVFR